MGCHYPSRIYRYPEKVAILAQNEVVLGEVSVTRYGHCCIHLAFSLLSY